MNRFTCSSSWFVWHNSLVTSNRRFLSYFDSLSLLVFSRLKLLTFSSFQPELLCLDWVGKLVLVIESRFPVNTTRTRRLLGTATPCACGILRHRDNLELSKPTSGILNSSDSRLDNNKVSYLGLGWVGVKQCRLRSFTLSDLGLATWG